MSWLCSVKRTGGRSLDWQRSRALYVECHDNIYVGSNAVLMVQYNILISFVCINRWEFYKTKHLELASYGCCKSTCAASVLFWPSSEKSMPHTSASVFCRTFHIETASVDIRLLPFCSPVFVLFLVEGNRDWVLRAILLQDGSFDF